MFFFFSVIQMISLLEVLTKEAMLRWSFSRFSRLREECRFGGFIFREVVDFKSAASLEGDSSMDISLGLC